MKGGYKCDGCQKNHRRRGMKFHGIKLLCFNCFRKCNTTIGGPMQEYGEFTNQIMCTIGLTESQKIVFNERSIELFGPRGRSKYLRSLILKDLQEDSK